METFKFEHIHLYSPDPYKTAEFYVETFGAENIGSNTDSKGRTIVDLMMNGINIKISHPWERDSKIGHSLDHFGFITENLDAAIAELKSKGINFVMEKTNVPTANISFLTGPEAVLIEVVEKTK